MRKFVNAQKLHGRKLKANSELLLTLDSRSTSATSQLTASTVSGSKNCLEILNFSLLPPDHICTLNMTNYATTISSRYFFCRTVKRLRIILQDALSHL